MPSPTGARSSSASRRLPLGRGPCLLPGRPLPGVVRHPQRPHPALGRVRRERLRVPLARGLHQRPHRRPPGPPGQLRAPRAPGHAHRVRRQRHRAGRPLPGRAPELTERRRRALRRVGLVHGPVLRHRPRLRGPAAGARGRRLPRLSDRSRHARGQPRRRRLRPPQRPRLLARRVPALHRRHGRHARPRRAPPHPRLRRRRRADARGRGRVRDLRLPASSTGSASTRPAGSGPRRATACTASSPTAP